MAVKERAYAKVSTPWLTPFLSSQWGALATHWIFQGMLQMDATERAFKLGLDALLFALWTGILARVLPLRWAAALAAFVAHSLNFLFNGQIYGALKHYGGPSRTWREFQAEVEALRRRVASEPSIRYAAAYGSLAREEWSPTSDLDVRLVRAPGVINGCRACWFAVHERTRALGHRFPLDLLVLDSPAALQGLAERDRPYVLFDAALEEQL